jgi:peptidoglycan/xylan/chitin deacetylase (PgdA/CDA1 family)
VSVSAAIGVSLAGSAAVAAILAHGALHRNSPVFGRVLGRLPGRGRRVALTFDDGPNPEATPRILDVLAREHVPATFFLLGRHVDRWPEVARRIVAEGHQVGQHGYVHRKLHLQRRAFVREDMVLGTMAVEQATQVFPRHFRAPHGFRNPWVSAVARSLGQRIVGWTLGVWDSDRPGAEVIARRAVAGIRPGTILLLHDGDGYDPHGDRTQTADALPSIIGGLRANGYELVGLPV